MKKNIIPLIIFLVSFILYFGMSTQFTFKPKWFLDYYNLLAQSLLAFRLDIQDTSTIYDLAYFQGKWYAPWGILPALVLIPIQSLMERFIPMLYFSIFFASVNITIFYLILQKLKEDFLPKLSTTSLFLILILFAFGTTHFYVGTLGGVWHVNQMVSAFFGMAGMYFAFRKKLSNLHYAVSAMLFSVAFLGRATVALLILFPIVLYVWNFYARRKANSVNGAAVLKKGLVVFGLPVVFFVSLLLLYNYLRFDNPFEYGYTHMYQEPASLEDIRKTNGIASFRNVPHNLWHMVFEIPRLSFKDGLDLSLNLKGNSIFFLTPPFLAAFLAFPVSRRKGRFTLNPYILALWITVLVTITPSLLFYNTGWIQFGYRYSLDVTALLILLSVFGLKGKLNSLFILSIIFAVVVHTIGIRALM